MNFNKAILLGRLTNEPTSRTLPSGQPVVTFGLATNRIYTDQEGNKQETTEFHNIVVFGKLADICSRYLNKGQLVLIEGRIQTRSWDAQDGTKRNRTEIIAENMQMGPRPAGSNLINQTEKSSEDQGEIPVIEAEESITEQNNPKQNNTANNLSENSNPEENTDEPDEINVKDIPF